MGIYSRVRDIINSNMSAMLDKAEDPEKLIKLMIREMEDTLVEIKASCAGAMATRKRIERDSGEVSARADEWGAKAQLAMEKGRENLAREALVEKRRHTERLEALKQELAQCDGMINQYHEEIQQIEDKLISAREKERMLVQRHIRALNKKRAQEDLRKADTTSALARFDTFENRIEQMEAEADLVNFGKKTDLEEEFRQLTGDEDIEKELEALKAKVRENK